MARVTVEDCIERIPNRFDLVMLVAQRARDISAGAALSVERDNDKNPVVSLREIAASTLNHEDLKESLIKGLQKHVEADEPEEDTLDVLPRPEFGADGVQLNAESMEGFQTVDEDSEDGFPGADFSEDGEDEASPEES